jgi:chromosome segregation ATPase|tara:strand:+ start:776 stop:1507 length:732 start_codon:yes stop_codon:yes gene_type:complete
MMRERTLNSQGQKRRLEDDLRALTDERDDLIRKMNELNNRYEDYVNSMNGEREQIIRANKTHVRLLTAKLLFQILGQALDKRAKYAIQEIKYCSKDMEDLEKRIHKFVKVMRDYTTERKRNSLRKWYRHAMNFVHENYKNQNLIRFNVNKKVKTQFFYQWRKAYLQRERSHGLKMDGLNVLRRFSESKEARTLRRYICHWRDICLKKESQQDFVFTIMQRKKKMHTRQAFVMWLAHSKRQGLE